MKKFQIGRIRWIIGWSRIYCPICVSIIVLITQGQNDRAIPRAILKAFALPQHIDVPLGRRHSCEKKYDNQYSYHGYPMKQRTPCHLLRQGVNGIQSCYDCRMFVHSQDSSRGMQVNRSSVNFVLCCWIVKRVTRVGDKVSQTFDFNYPPRSPRKAGGGITQANAQIQSTIAEREASEDYFEPSLSGQAISR